ncbi:glycoside hydrolase family 76 protein [Aulographum hederae CBS 113979]|uniref:mannan endo-1,6-alpha-mannosidase n=1 Tax=Aulographum hederae CBS 113979 TaxID=1176131 RepID=A0A6G1GVU1_9PEZI|nr:glycoside hydrolase family 76 protein [Aulographum hederae CBS 113979]
MYLRQYLAAVALLLNSHNKVAFVGAIELDISSTDSIKEAARITANGLMSYYTGYQPGHTEGLLPDPYYWWEAGAMFGQMIDYWSYTSDARYNTKVTSGILAQIGANADFMPSNQTRTEGNDDQQFFAFAALTAAESNFPFPSSFPSSSSADSSESTSSSSSSSSTDTSPISWLTLAQSVFNQQALRWDPSTCSGGLRWQIYPFNNGYNYKNMVSNGGFFQLAARLARYTGNGTYSDWADKVWDWMEASVMLTEDGVAFDGMDVLEECKTPNRVLFSYNSGTLVAGAAYMYNHTTLPIWRTRLTTLLSATHTFFPPDYSNTTMDEISLHACAVSKTCTADQPSFKAYLARSLAVTTQLAPFTAAEIMPLLAGSAKAAARSCSGGPSGTECGLMWWKEEGWDGNVGVGEQMSAMSVIGANLVSLARPPVTMVTGGESKGDPAAGTRPKGAGRQEAEMKPVTKKDTVGAWVLAAVVMVFVGAMGAFVVWDEGEEKFVGQRDPAFLGKDRMWPGEYERYLESRWTLDTL